MPGTRKICSVTMAPPNTAGICSATSVTTGISALRTTCLRITDALGQALGARGGHVVEADHVEHRRAHVARPDARLEQAQHGDRHDRLLEVLPVPAPAGARDVGAVDERQPVELDAENSRISRRPVKKVGSEKPMKASVLAMLVEQRIRARRRDRCPPAARSAAPAPATSRSPASVVGRRCRISVSTLMRLANEKPQSPCSIAASQRR